MIPAILIIVAVVGVALQMMALIDELGRVASGCLCGRHAVNPRCPLHGSEKEALQ